MDVPAEREATDLGTGLEGAKSRTQKAVVRLGCSYRSLLWLSGFAKEDLSRGPGFRKGLHLLKDVHNLQVPGAEVERPLGGEELGDTESLDPENLNAESPSNNAEDR